MTSPILEKPAVTQVTRTLSVPSEEDATRIFRPYFLSALTWNDASGDHAAEQTNAVRLPVVIRRDDEGYCAYVPVLRGALAEGKTEAETLQDMTDTLVALFETYREQSRPIPWTEVPCFHEEDDAQHVEWISVQQG